MRRRFCRNLEILLITPLGRLFFKMQYDKDEVMIYNNGKYEKEQIPAEKWMRLIYGNSAGLAPLLFLIKRKVLSRIYGAYCRTEHSAKKIPEFIKKYNIDMNGHSGSYKSFAEFFARAKDKDSVFFPSEPEVLGSPCEGVLSAYVDIDPQKTISAKGSHFSLAELFADEDMAKAYEGGTMIKIRLVPSDYHRAHFFDDGVVTDSKLVNGALLSVNPLAVRSMARLYCVNKRAVVSFSSKNFGDVVFVEVGATFVGSIVHSFEVGKPVERGQEAGYFLPGGSLIMMFFKKGEVVPGEEFLKQTEAGFETRVRLGDAIGRAGM